MYEKTKGYQSGLSIDLRVFNNQEKDYGVNAFIEKLGFIPDYVFNHETYVGQIHSHDGKLDDTPLLLTWSAQRGIPGGQLWTRQQYRTLVDELHAHGIRFFQGAEAAWSVWPEYGESSRDTWLYSHMPELFVTYKNAKTTADEMGMINPLKHLSDGTLYEDRLLKDVLKFLNDYHMDGFFAADGFGGLCCKVVDGDFSDDITTQFSEYTGIKVLGNTIPERADYILKNYRFEWSDFYANRWAAFYRKLCPAFKAAGKEFIVMAPFKHGPADSFMEYGFDYRRNAEAGLDFLALESMETSSRRWQYTQAMEAVGISNVTTIKAISPSTRLFWMSSVCNCPEHWHTLRDIPNALERECLALNTARAIGEGGNLIKGYTGVQPLFGIDLSASEWRWYKERLDIGHMDIASNEGLVILWSENVMLENARRGITYPLSSEVVKLRFSGLPIQTAALIANAKYAKNKTMLLVQPIGVSDEEAGLVCELSEHYGKNLLIVGQVEHPMLLKLLGLKRNTHHTKSWRLCASDAFYTENLPACEGIAQEELGGYSSETAEIIVSAQGVPDERGVVLSVKRQNDSCAIYLRHVIEKLPPARHKRSEMDWVAHPNLRGPENDLLTIQQVMQSLSNIHPDSLDLIAARCVQHLDGTFAYSDKGQVLSFTGTDGQHYLLCENPLNMQYIIMTVTLPRARKYFRELPIRSKGPVGYAYFGDVRPNKIDVSVPPEAVIPFLMEYEDE